MIAPLLVALALIALTIVIQVLAINLILRYLGSHYFRSEQATGLALEVVFLSVAMGIMMLGHCLQMALWAAVFLALGQFDGFAEAFYHSAVNFTTLGYGDIVMEEPWRVLGPLEGANGVLMFALSGALFFVLLQKAYARSSALGGQGSDGGDTGA